MTLWLLAVGLVTLLGQVVLLREVLVASFGSELIYLLGMGLQMLGTALGAMAGRRTAQESEARVSALFLGFAVTLPGMVGLARALRVIFRGTPGAYLPFLQQLSGIALVLLPLGVSGGLLFTSAARLVVVRSRTLAAAYAVESIGGLIGGALSTMLIALGVQNLAAAILCSVIAATAALFPWRAARPSWLRPAASALAVLLAFALAASKWIDRELTGLNHPQLLDTRDTPYGRATVTGSLGQVVVFENDALAFESQGTSAEEFVHVAALQVRSPRSVLVLGGAIEGLVPEVRKHRPASVRDVEVDKRLLDLALPFLAPELTTPLRAPHDGVTLEDPRRFLERPGHYDLILSGMPEPESGQASRYYTREFFDLCARRLSAGGVMAFRLRSSENLWTPALARRTASIVRAVRSAFSDVMVLPGTVNVVIASNGRLERDPEVLSSRFRERRIEARLVSPPYLRYLYTNDRVAGIARVLAQTSAPESSDARPVCYQYTLVLWLSRFFPTLARVDVPALASSDLRGASGSWIAIAILLIVAVAACRRSPALRRILLAGFAGLAGMLLEGSLILAYQISRGVLYRDIGILLTMFMAGLALGSWSIDRRAASTQGLTAGTGGAILLGTTALACLTAWSVASPGGNSLWRTALFLVAAGFLTGALFAFASLRRVENQALVVAPLYAADLLGGCAGSIAGSLFLIPLLGLPASVLLVGLLSILALLLV